MGTVMKIGTMISLFSLLLCPALLSCTPEQGKTDIKPAVQVTVTRTDVDNATLKIEKLNADGAYVLVLPKSSGAPSADQIHKDGRKVEFEGRSYNWTATGLKQKTAYCAYAVAYTKKGTLSSVASAAFNTARGAGEMYPWESERTSLPKYSNLALCYGGSAHRSAFIWDVDRFQSHVSYKDENGYEHWLFDAFLAIEFVYTQTNMSLTIGNGRESGDKKSWQGLIDYWFADGTGFDALEKAIENTKVRLGNPGFKHKVVMVMPDPIPYKMFNDPKSSTKYWGEVNGVELNFANDDDRLIAMQWYIDEVRERWYQKGYDNIELIGFYCVSEDLAVPENFHTPGFHGWSYELKRWENIYPAISKYIHSCNESVNWIPYYKAGAYELWKYFEIDNVQMQPNYFWGYAANHPTYTLAEFKSMVKSAGISMEMEMDDAMLASSAGCQEYQVRFREYMALAKETGLYGTREISYYMGENTFYKLSKSKNSDDIKMYQELCEFITGNRK